MGSTGTQAINVHLFARLPYNPQIDFFPLTLMTIYPQLIVPGERFKSASLDSLVAGLKRVPGEASYGSSGVGSPTHLAGELFKRETGTDLIHVPYRGQGPALNDLLGGRLDLMFPSVPDVLSFLQAGKLRAIAVMAQSRLKILSDVPTTAELDHPQLLSAIWGGFYINAATPKPITDRLHRELVRIISSSGFRNAVEPLGFEVKPMSPDEFRAFGLEETKRWGEFIKARGIKLD